MREKIELLKHHANMLAKLVDVGRRTGDLLALDEDVTTRRLFKKVDAAQHRRLARARGAQNDNYLALLDIDVHISQNLGVAEGFGKMLDAYHDVVIGFAHRVPFVQKNMARMTAPCWIRN